jgi:hypothetical protein
MYTDKREIQTNWGTGVGQGYMVTGVVYRCTGVSSSTGLQGCMVCKGLQRFWSCIHVQWVQEKYRGTEVQM